MRAVIERLSGEPADRLGALVAESERQGFRFVRRLVDEWRSGANRFDRPGEVLFAARAGDDVIGVCGLNIDPHADDPGDTADRQVPREVDDLQVARDGLGREDISDDFEAIRGIADSGVRPQRDGRAGDQRGLAVAAVDNRAPLALRIEQDLPCPRVDLHDRQHARTRLRGADSNIAVRGLHELQHCAVRLGDVDVAGAAVDGGQ